MDINTATLQQISSLSGIGVTMAQAIIDYRNQNGPFKTFTELENIKGLGAKKQQILQSNCVLTTGASSEKPYKTTSTRSHQTRKPTFPSAKAETTSARGFDKQFPVKHEVKPSQYSDRAADDNKVKTFQVGKTETSSRFQEDKAGVKDSSSRNKRSTKTIKQEKHHETYDGFIGHVNTQQSQYNLSHSVRHNTATKPGQPSRTENVLIKEYKVNVTNDIEKEFDINSVTAEQLHSLPGVSKELAQRIVDYRKKYGLFETLNDLKAIHGVGDAKCDTLKDNCFVGKSNQIYKRDRSEGVSEVTGLFPHVNVLVNRGNNCDYISEEDFYKTCCLDGYMILHVNIRSLRRNIRKLRDLIESMCKQPDVICLSEAKNPKPEDVNIPSYVFKCQHTPTNAGGVAIYVKQKYNVEERKDLQFLITDCENLWVEINGIDGKSVIVGAVYRHPRDNFGSFPDKLVEVVYRIRNENKKFYILGDININMLESSVKLEEYCNLLHEHQCSLLITKPTRVPKAIRAGKTLIDHIYTNNAEQAESGVIESDISDHYPVYCIVKRSNTLRRANNF